MLIQLLTIFKQSYECYHLEINMASSPEKQALFNEFARLGKGLAHPSRLELLDFLCNAPRTVETLAQLIGRSVANTSHHLQILSGVRLVSASKAGKYVIYRLANPEITEFWQIFQKLAYNQLADLRHAAEEYLGSIDIYEPVDRESLLDQMRQGVVTLIDVRPEEEFQEGHLPGAISIPLERLEELLPELPRDHQIVAYCRGPFCFLSGEAVKVLRRHNRRATRLADGVTQWQMAGLPIELGISN